MSTRDDRAERRALLCGRRPERAAGAAALAGAAAAVLFGPFRGGAAGPPLAAKKPIVVPGGPGAFDWMAVDPPMRRLLAAHKGTKTLTVMDLDHQRVLPAIPTGAAQGIAVDAADEKIFVGNEDEHNVVVLDRKTLVKKATIPLTGPVDAMAYDPKNGRVYADEDNGKQVWVLDGKTEKVVGTVPVAGPPEYLEYEPGTDRLYQNIKTTDTVQVIDPNDNRAYASWSTAPASSPHGLAIDGKVGRIFTAGRNGQLAVLDLHDGKRVVSVEIAPGVDQIAFDPAKQRVYRACTAFISVVQETAGGATLLANVPAPRGAHTITVDPKTHSVWVCYADQKDSYLQEFTPAE